MIDHLYIDGFKSLRDIKLDPRALNVLVGSNGSGKSSVLQTLLLLRQSVDADREHLEWLNLSGELYEAGMPLDAINPTANHTIEIHIRDSDLRFDLHGPFTYNRDDLAAANSRRLKGDIGGTLTAEAISTFPLFSRQGAFAYLNAERLGPRVTQSLPLGGESLDGRVGKFGQYTAAILARAFNNDEKVRGWDNRIARKFFKALSALDSPSLVEKLEAAQGSLFRLSNIMLEWIIPGSDFVATENSDTDNAVLMFTRDASGTRTKTRATHAGFGLSYALPIVVGALSLSPGGLLLAENPEAHLHPYGQSRMGAFLALIASTNRQVFVETHSDHVVNGMRLAVRYGLIPFEDVRIYFFHNVFGSGQSKVTEIQVDARGGLSSWPAGFFDQIEQDLARL